MNFFHVWDKGLRTDYKDALSLEREANADIPARARNHCPLSDFSENLDLGYGAKYKYWVGIIEKERVARKFPNALLRAAITTKPIRGLNPLWLQERLSPVEIVDTVLTSLTDLFAYGNEYKTLLKLAAKQKLCKLAEVRLGSSPEYIEGNGLIEIKLRKLKLEAEKLASSGEEAEPPTTKPPAQSK